MIWEARFVLATYLYPGLSVYILGNKQHFELGFSFPSFFLLLYFFKDKRHSDTESWVNHLPQSIGHHRQWSMQMSSHCICHFIFISIPTLSRLLLIGEPVVVLLCILLFVYILRKQVLLICLCVVLIYINYIVFQVSFFYLLLNALLFKVLSKLCACISTFYCVVYLYCICLSLLSFLGIWIFSNSIGLAEIEKLDISKW